MYSRIRDLLVSCVTSIQARLIDKGASAGVDARRLGNFLNADTSCNSFDIEELPGCHPGTLNAVVLSLLDWTATDPTPFVCWLTGLPGAGKSTVARSLIAHLESENRLTACFFFNKVDRNRNSIKSLVPTLARQIAQAIPEFQSQIPKVVAYNSRSSKQSFRSQFEKFISIPLSRLNLSPARRRTSLPVLIVIDGLDGCDSDQERSLFLKTVFEAAPRLRRYLKFLIVSRPEVDIQNFFEPTGIQDDLSVIDLSAYLSFSTPDILPPSPLHNSIHDTDALFRTILSSSTTSQTTSVGLLSVVLVCLQADMSPLNPLKDIPMSFTQSNRFMESILDLEPESLQSALSDLKALLSFQRKMTIDGRPFHDVRIIKLVHGSLQDFLLDQSRSREFYIDLKTACLTVAKGILRVLADNSRSEQRYWGEVGCDPRPAYHNCLVWCYEHLSPDEELQRAIKEYDPIDYLSIGRNSITYPTAVAFFTFACKSLRRFEDSPSNDISNHLRGYLDRYLKSELDHWVSHNANLMRVLRTSIFPDRIDWESFRSSDEMVGWDHNSIIRKMEGEHLPYFLAWMFDKGLGYAGSTVERTVCGFFYSEDRAGKYYFGQLVSL